MRRTARRPTASRRKSGLLFCSELGLFSREHEKAAAFLTSSPLLMKKSTRSAASISVDSCVITRLEAPGDKTVSSLKG